MKFGRSFPCSTSRAASRLKNMFKLARTYRSSGVERAYVYNWTGAGCDARFDAGLTTPSGATRPAYTVLRQQLAQLPALVREELQAPVVAAHVVAPADTRSRPRRAA